MELSLAEFEVEEGTLQKAVGELFSRNLDDGDLYLEMTEKETLTTEQGQVDSSTHSVNKGAGLRGVAGERTGLAYTNTVDAPALMAAARTARAIGEGRGRDVPTAVRLSQPSAGLYPVLRPTLDEPFKEKIKLLKTIDRAARAQDGRIKDVFVTLVGERKRVAILSADGRMAFDDRPLSRISVTCVASDGTRSSQGTAAGGGRRGYDDIAEEGQWDFLAKEAARLALLDLEAEPAPAGEQIVVLGPGWPGILLHEAIGHGLEGDFNRRGSSAFSGRIGERVASPLVTVVDDGTMYGRRGSLNVDDEGTPTERTVLIEKGILKAYLQDRLNGRLMGMASTGNGRRQSFAHAPIPRMTNTFMLGGDHHPEEIIRSVSKGIYARSFGGGQVDITSGKFTFSASEAYLIEDGRVTRPVRGATLIGNGPDVLTRVAAVGRDLALDRGYGLCGKDGQSVPVGVGLPTVRIDGITVGGVQL